LKEQQKVKKEVNPIWKNGQGTWLAFHTEEEMQVTMKHKKKVFNLMFNQGIQS
jgi:hypothetical protein